MAMSLHYFLEGGRGMSISYYQHASIRQSGLPLLVYAMSFRLGGFLVLLDNYLRRFCVYRQTVDGCVGGSFYGWCRNDEQHVGLRVAVPATPSGFHASAPTRNG